MSIDPHSLGLHGAVRVDGILEAAEIASLAEELDAEFQSGPGARLFGRNGVARLTGPEGALNSLAVELLGRGARAVRALAFDKRPDANWVVGWHQDRTIAVRARIDTPGFGPWSIKCGIPHVEPPFAILAEMITMRLHLDDCGPDNAPLRVAIGSHLFGRVAGSEAVTAAGRCEQVVCLARAGDVWIYRTPVLHASRPSLAEGRRRVVQIDFAAQDLPGGLEWAGIA